MLAGCVNTLGMISSTASTSYGYASYESESAFLHVYRFRKVAEWYLQDDTPCLTNVPGHLRAFWNDLQDLVAYGTGLCEPLHQKLLAWDVDLGEPHEMPAANRDRDDARKLRETAHRMLCLLQDREPIEEFLDSTSQPIGVMCREEEGLLKTCLDIYRQGQPSTLPDVGSMSRSELEEAVISEWRREARVRSKLSAGPVLQENFWKACGDLGFTSARVPEAGVWNYVVITGGTLIGMEKKCSFLQKCISNGVVPDQVIMLASSRPRDSAADHSSHVLVPDDCATEAGLAERLRQYLARNSDHAELWSSALVVPTDNPKAGFAETFQTWLQTSPCPGRLLVVSGQPFIPRYRVQASRLLHATEFRKECLEVIGEGLCENFPSTKSSVLLDAIAHWVQIQREAA